MNKTWFVSIALIFLVVTGLAGCSAAPESPGFERPFDYIGVGLAMFGIIFCSYLIYKITCIKSDQK